MHNPKTKDFATVLEEERNNIKTTVSRYPEEAKYFDKILYLYENLISHLQYSITPVLQMYWTCFRGFLISSQLMFQAHIPESYTIISRSAEAVASARKMSMNPEKLPKWIKPKKETSQPFRRLLGKLFPKEDKVVFPEIFNIYKFTSEYGRHPSFESTVFFTGLAKAKIRGEVTFTYSDIEDELNLRRCLNYQIYAYLKFLSAFKEIFKKNIDKEWVKEYEQIKSEYGAYKKTLRSLFQNG